ncbi:hypothetical protein MF265_16685 [Serratia marcescens]|uniref:beta family protein n=1 Tax=Serratia marcescens TaxID=615 RepID=UPI001EEF885C|nr:hypothetical protein [Serratia marcescens]ULH09601.1 hypothetical protein MF265_16685 [Serratia marcescens]
MNYFVFIKNAMDDISAICSLRDEQKDEITPIILTSGNAFKRKNNIITTELKKDYLLDEFLQSWGDREFLVDVSRGDSDANSEYNEHYKLNKQDNGYSGRVEYFKRIKENNKNIIPTISWNSNDNLRNILRFSLNLESYFDKIAINIHIKNENSLKNARLILSAIERPHKAKVILNLESINEEYKPNESKISEIIDELINDYSIEDIILASSSFPDSKPKERDIWVTTECKDMTWQIPLIFKYRSKVKVHYGDYAATSPNAATDYIIGMQIIPCVTYFRIGYWHQMKSGNDKQFEKFVELAQKIVNSAFYHNDSFCAANESISTIAKTGEKYGTSGTWNGYKMNQHISECLNILNHLNSSWSEDTDEA